METNAFTRMEMATIKKIYGIEKPLRKKLYKVQETIAKLETERARLLDKIEKFEEPIREITHGLSSAEIIEGTVQVTTTEATASNESTTETGVDEIDFAYAQ